VSSFSHLQHSHTTYCLCTQFPHWLNRHKGIPSPMWFNLLRMETTGCHTISNTHVFCEMGVEVFGAQIRMRSLLYCPHIHVYHIRSAALYYMAVRIYPLQWFSSSRSSVRCLAETRSCQTAPRATHSRGSTVSSHKPTQQIECSRRFIHLCVANSGLPLITICLNAPVGYNTEFITFRNWKGMVESSLSSCWPECIKRTICRLWIN